MQEADLAFRCTLRLSTSRCGNLIARSKLILTMDKDETTTELGFNGG